MKGGSEMVMEWIWKLHNMAFEIDVVPDDGRSAVIVSVYKGKGERAMSEL